jgi:hypothetical protein
LRRHCGKSRSRGGGDGGGDDELADHCGHPEFSMLGAHYWGPLEPRLNAPFIWRLFARGFVQPFDREAT